MHNTIHRGLVVEKIKEQEILRQTQHLESTVYLVRGRYINPIGKKESAFQLAFGGAIHLSAAESSTASLLRRGISFRADLVTPSKTAEFCPKVLDECSQR